MFTIFKKSDFLILITMSAMIGFGLLGILSAGITLGSETPSFRFIERQLIYVLIGSGALLCTCLTNYQLYRFKTQIPYLFTIILLALVFFFGDQSWLSIFGLFNIQPSEIGKLVIIIYLAYVMSFERIGPMKFLRHSLPIMLTCIILIAPTILQPDFGTALVMSLITGYILFIGGMPLAHILVPVIVAVPGIIIVPFRYPHVMKRITDFLAILTPGLNPSSLSFHDLQFRLAMGNGGFTGTGFCKGIIKRSFLPASHTDSIFAVLVEEGGFLTGLIIIGLFLALIYLGERTAQHTHDRFGALLVRGITFYLTAQAFLNIGVCLGLLPNTGVTLPFLSYGGSSIIVSMAAVGILINISSQRQIIY